MIIGQINSMLRAAGFACQGVARAARQERAFRQELAVFLPGMVLAAWLAQSLAGFALLVLPFVFVLALELMNSAVEAAVDRMGEEHHPLAGDAKDYAAAAVFLGNGTVALIWLGYLVNRFWGNGS